VHKKITHFNLKCTVGLRSSTAMTQTRLKSPKNRAASRTVLRWSSIGGHYVCVEELDIVKMKNLHDYSIYYLIFQSGGLAAFLGGNKPSKNAPQRHDWLQPAAIFWGTKCNLLLHPTTKHDFENFRRANCPSSPTPRLWACLPSATLHVNCKSWF